MFAIKTQSQCVLCLTGKPLANVAYSHFWHVPRQEIAFNSFVNTPMKGQKKLTFSNLGTSADFPQKISAENYKVRYCSMLSPFGKNNEKVRNLFQGSPTAFYVKERA